MPKKCIALWLALALAAYAKPPIVRTSAPGDSYQIESAMPEREKTWLAGSVGAGPETFGDAYLAVLNSSGQTLWEKRFGSPEGGDTVRALLPLANDGVVLICGRLQSHLDLAWSGQPDTDWSQQSFVALVDQQGQLLAGKELQAAPSPEAQGEAYEPDLSIRCLAETSSGELYAGGSLTGCFGDLVSSQGGRQPTAILLRFSPELKLLEAVLQPGESLDLLSAEGDRLLAAGRAESGQDDPMAASVSCAVAWNLSQPTNPVELWRGERRENTQCLQLDEDSLLVSDNVTEAPYEVDLRTSEVGESLPQGALAKTAWGKDHFATGFRTDQVGESLSEVGRAILWKKDQQWTPVLRWGSERRDFVPFIFPQADGLTLVGTTEGQLPNQQPAEGAKQRWIWVHFDQLPKPDEASAMGVRDLESTERELASDLDQLTFIQRPGFDHLAGFVPTQSGPAAIVTGEGAGFDHWSCESKLGKLASWSPATPPFAPMEPQIFPRVSGAMVVCRDFLWPSPEAGVMGAHWFVLDGDGKQKAARSVIGEHSFDCQEVLELDDGASVMMGVEWNAQEQRRLCLLGISADGGDIWKQGAGSWLEFVTLQWIAAGRLDSKQLVAMTNTEGQLQLQSFHLTGKPGWSQPLGQRYGHTLGVIAGQIWAVTSTDDSCEDLLLQIYSSDGKMVRRQELPITAASRIRDLVATGPEVTMVGECLDQGRSRGLVATFNSKDTSCRWRLLNVQPSHGLHHAIWTGQDLWVGGEVTRDYQSDPFWGRLRQSPEKIRVDSRELVK